MEKLTNVFKIEYTKGDTYALTIKFKNITEDLRIAYFTVKENPDDSPLIQKSLGSGISKIDDRAYKNEKTYKFQLQPADTLNLEPKVQYLYDIQVTVGNVVKTVLHGVFVLNSTITGTSQITTPTLEVEIDDEFETEIETTPATNGVEYEQDPVACAKIGDMTTLKTTSKDTVVKAVNEVKENTNTNADDINKFKNGTIELPSTKNVSETINNVALDEIFEENGKTVKSSTNVTQKINGKNISDIFESDGTTVKNSTTAGTSTNSQKAVPTDAGNYYGFTYEESNHLLKFGANIVENKKIVWQGSTDVTTDGVDINVGTLPFFTENTKIMFDYVVGVAGSTTNDVEKSSIIFKAPINKTDYSVFQNIETILDIADNTTYSAVISARLNFKITNNHTISFKADGKFTSGYKFVIKKIYTVLG